MGTTKKSVTIAELRAIYASSLVKLTRVVEREKKKYQTLGAKNHDELGRILKLHLILEHYIGRYLLSQVGLSESALSKLTFAKKVERLPNTGFIGTIKPGIAAFNGIRNRYAHSLSATLSRTQMVEIDSLLSWLLDDVESRSKIERLELFCYLSFASLLSMPHRLEAKIGAANKRAMQLVRRGLHDA